MNHRNSIDKVDIKQLTPRESAVLLHLFYDQNRWNTVLIERSQYNGVHSRQISLPGGKVEETDKSFEETALREACEEVNILSSELEVLGQLSQLYIPPSNFLVQPIVSFQTSRPNFVPDIREVENILEIPLNELLTTKLTTQGINQANAPAEVQGYYLNERVVWGATAMILTEFIDLVRNL
jgi:8-oxo-dGTP pyrophosphatase MutT (NUDIX family)